MFLTSSFLQIPPHDGHPCLRLYPSHYRADSGLAPVRNVRRRAHKKKIPLPVKILLIRVFLTQKALFYYATYLCLLKRRTVSTVFPFSHEIVSTSSPLTTTGKLNVTFLMGCSYLSCSSFGYICISLIKP